MLGKRAGHDFADGFYDGCDEPHVFGKASL